MVAGLFIDHGNGKVIDTRKRFARISGSFQTNGIVRGSFFVAAPNTRNFMYFSSYIGSSTNVWSWDNVPVWWDSSTSRVHWDYTRDVDYGGSTSGPILHNHKVYYGFY